MIKINARSFSFRSSNALLELDNDKGLSSRLILLCSFVLLVLPRNAGPLSRALEKTARFYSWISLHHFFVGQRQNNGQPGRRRSMFAEIVGVLKEDISVSRSCGETNAQRIVDLHSPFLCQTLLSSSSALASVSLEQQAHHPN